MNGTDQVPDLTGRGERQKHKKAKSFQRVGSVMNKIQEMQLHDEKKKTQFKNTRGICMDGSPKKTKMASKHIKICSNH